jgi:hypothetical protein
MCESGGIDFNFQYKWVPNNYGARVQRAAVLYPLVGLAHSVGDIVEKTKQVVNLWRIRAAMMVQAGWNRANQHAGFLAFARNCSPSFVHTLPAGRSCKNTLICPFCWSRWTQQVWELLDRTFPNPRQGSAIGDYFPVSRRAAACEITTDLPDDGESEPDTRTGSGQPLYHGRALRAIQLNDASERTGDYHLIERKRTTIFPAERDWKAPEEWIRAIMEGAARSRTKLMRKIHPRGAFVCTTLAPATEPGWKVVTRSLLMTSPDYVVPEETGTESVVQMTRHTMPTRRTIFGAVARVCRYPAQLLRGDVSRVVLMLNARRGQRGENPLPLIRLSANYGVFRSNIERS